MHTITATYSPDPEFTGSTGTLASGLQVTPAPPYHHRAGEHEDLQLTAAASATPTVSGLVGSDSVTGQTEIYSDANAGTSKTLNVVPSMLLTTITMAITTP